MSKKLAEKVAVVTGASKGIGAEIAKQLAVEGAAVVVNYSSSKEGAEKVVKEITSGGGKAIAVQANVANYESSVNKVFACGDMRRGQSLVVWAIREGRQCAQAVDMFLMGKSDLPR